MTTAEDSFSSSNISLAGFADSTHFLLENTFGYAGNSAGAVVAGITGARHLPFRRIRSSCQAICKIFEWRDEIMFLLYAPRLLPVDKLSMLG